MAKHQREIWLHNLLLDGYDGVGVSEQEVAAEVERLRADGCEADYRVEIRRLGVVAILEWQEKNEGRGAA